MNKFYEFKKVNEQETDLYVYGDITSMKWYESDVGGYDFAKDLAEIDTDINVHINSYGGEVSEGLAIYNLLKAFPHKVTTINDGFACSSASVVFMAGTERVMNKGSLLLIHNAWTYASGDANELRKQADDLEKVTMPSIAIYTSVTGLDEKKIREMMDNETWITSDEALEMGFATSIREEEPKQSINERFLTHQVMENKRLAKELSLNVDLLKTQMMLNEKLANEIDSLKAPKTGWDAFFE